SPGLHAFLGSMLSQHNSRRVRRADPHQEKYDQRYAKQNGNQLQQPLHNVFCHSFSLLCLWSFPDRDQLFSEQAIVSLSAQKRAYPSALLFTAERGQISLPSCSL